MDYTSVLVLSLCCSIIIGRCSGGDELAFPSSFKFGAASAAYQVEGGWNASDKSENIWDRLLHTMPELTGGQNGDVACDSYRLWQRDIEMCEELGLNIYRFSISWSRLLPTGFPNIISDDGKNYYSNLINGLLEKNIEPVVTLYHFDLPQSLQDLGGWANPLVSDWFADYARVVYSLFADRVKYWLTINEPFGICDLGYDKKQAPYIADIKVAKYLCNKHTMIAHAKAWRIYDQEYKPLYGGKVSLATLFIWYEPFSPDDADLTQLIIEHWEGRYAHPIFSEKGGWPPNIEKFLNDKGKEENYPHPRLPPFTAEEIQFVKGTYDFYGLNHYTTRLVRKAKPGEVGPNSWPFYGSEELGIMLENDPSWQVGDIDWFGMYPEGLRKQLHWLNQTYGVTDVLITENGYVNFEKGPRDFDRLVYMEKYLEQILFAIQDGLNVMGYTAWTLMDNFEWLSGYNLKYGLYAVDFTHENRTRTPRESARYYSRLTRNKTPDNTAANYL